MEKWTDRMRRDIEQSKKGGRAGGTSSPSVLPTTRTSAVVQRTPAPQNVQTGQSTASGRWTDRLRQDIAKGEVHGRKSDLASAVEMPTLTQRMALFGDPFASLKIRDATMPKASSTMQPASATVPTAEKPKSTDAWTWRELSSKDKAATSTAKKASPTMLKGDETPELVESKMRSLQSEQTAYKTYLELLGKNMGDNPTEEQAEAYLKVAALYQDTGKVADEYVSYLKEYYTPEAYQKRIDDMQVELDSAKQAANPAQFVDPGRTSYSQRADMDAAKKQAEELEEKIGLEKKGKALAEYELLRQNLDFEEKSKPDPKLANAVRAARYSPLDGELLDAGFTDIDYAAINGNGNALILAKSGQIHRDVPKDAVALYNYIYATKGREEADRYIDLVAETAYDGLDALALGLYRGTGLQSIADTAWGVMGGITGHKEISDELSGIYATAGAQASNQHPVLYGVGQVGGTLTLMGGAAKAVAAIPGFASLSPAAQTVISSVAARGGTTAIQGLGDAVSGQREWGDYAADVFTDSFAGAASGGMSHAIGTAGASFLNAHGLTENMLARNVVAVASGLGYSMSNTAVTEGMAYLRDPEGYEFDAGQALEDAVVNVAFSVIGNLTKNYTTDPATAAQMDADDALIEKYFKDMTPEAAKKEYHRLARANHSDLHAGQGDEAMKEINRAWNAYTDRIKASGASAYQAAEAAKASGDTAAYKKAAADFADSVNGLQSIVETGGAATAEVAEAMQILNAVSASMSRSPEAMTSPTAPTAGIMPTAGGTADLVGAEKLPTASGSTAPTMPTNLPAAGGTPDSLPTASGMAVAQKTAPTGEAELPRMTMADFTDTGSPVWRNVDYEDKEAQRQITQATHQQMVSEGRVVSVSGDTAEKVAPFYPDVRALPRAEKNSVLKEKTDALKRTLRQFLGGLRDTSFEFEVNGNILEAKLYGRGISEVMKKLTQDKASMLYHSGEIFKGAQYLYSTPDYDGDPNIYRWNYFYTPVQIGSETVGVRIAVRDLKQTAYGVPESQIYHWGIKQGTSVDGGGPEQGSLSSRVSLDVPKDTIPQTPPEVNPGSIEPMSDEWLDDLVTNGEHGYVPKEDRTAEEIAISQGLEEDRTPKPARQLTAEDVEAEQFRGVISTSTQNVLKAYGSKASEGEISQGLWDIFERMGRDEGISEAQLAEETAALARQLLESVEVVNREAYQDSKAARSLIRAKTIHVPPEVALDIPDYSAFQKRYFGSMKLSSTTGRKIDDLFQELGNYDVGGYFDAQEYLAPSDQLLQIAKFLDETKPRMENPYLAVMDEASQSMGEELAQTLRTIDGRRRALRAAQSVREAMSGFYASAWPGATEPEEVATPLNDLPTTKEPIKSRAKEYGRTLYRLLVDTGEAVERFGNMVGDKQLYHYYNYARASSSAGQNMLAPGGYQADIMGRNVGPSLGDIISPIRAKGEDYYTDFQLYLFHMHNVDRMSRYSAAAEDAAYADLETFKAEYPEVATLEDAVLYEWAAQGDPLAQELLQRKDAWQHAKNTQNKPVFGPDVAAEDSRGEAAKLLEKHPEFSDLSQEVYQYSNNLLQYQVDSGLMTQEDMENIQAIYPHYVPTYRVENGDSRAVKKAGIRISKVLGRATGGNANLIPIHVSLARQTMRVVRNGSANRFANRLMDGYLRNRTTTGEFIFDAVETSSAIHPDTFDIQEDPTPENSNTFTVYREGKSLTVTASSGILDAMELLTGSKTQGSTAIDIAFKPFKAMNSLFKSLVTGYNPMFSARNFARDMQEAGLYSQDLAAWAKAYPKAVQEIATNGEIWQRYKALGGVWSSVFDYKQGYKAEGEGHSKLRKYTLDKVDVFNMGVEQAPRLAEFIAQMEKNGDSMDAVMNAMYSAANVTTNFGRSGKVGAFLNKTFVPFLNPSIQGLDKMARTFFGKKTRREWLRLVAKVAILGLSPFILNEVINHGAPGWDDIRDNEKDTNWLIHIGDGKYLRIPKGRDMSVLLMGADRIADAVQGKEVDVGGTLATAAGQIAPANPLENNILAAWVNADLFDPKSPGKTWYGGDIESQRLQSLHPAQRYDEKTDYLSRAIGGITGLSPKKINYILDQYSGVVGDFTLPYLTPAGDKSPLAPLTKAFVLDSTTNNRVSDDFYDEKDRVTWEKNGGKPEQGATLRFLNKKSGEISDLYEQIREIQNAGLPNGEMLKQVRELRQQINEIERDTLEDLPAYEAAAAKNYEAAAARHHVGDDEQAVVDRAYRETNREIFGAEYALEMEGKETYEKAKEAHELGASYESYYTAYVALKGKTHKASKQQALNGLDIPEKERDAIYAVVIGRDRAEELAKSGLTKAEAQKVTWAVENILPRHGKQTASSVQKWQAVVNCGLSPEKTVKGLKAVMSESQYKKLKAANSCGVSATVYVNFSEAMEKETKKNQETAERVLKGFEMTKEQKAVLWQMVDTSWDPWKNPFSRPAGRKVLDIYNGKG